MSVERVSAAEARELLGQGYLYLDVRSVQEFDGGHPEGAYNIPLLCLTSRGMEPNPSFLEEVEVNFPKDSAIIVGCRSGQRSLRAAEMMVAAGYARVVDLRPGYAGVTDPFGRLLEPGWQAEGLPIRTEPEPGRSHEELSRKNEENEP